MADFVTNETLCFATTSSTIPEPGTPRKKKQQQLHISTGAGTATSDQRARLLNIEFSKM
jgi:hypothetical protein